MDRPMVKFIKEKDEWPISRNWAHYRGIDIHLIILPSVEAQSYGMTWGDQIAWVFFYDNPKTGYKDEYVNTLPTPGKTDPKTNQFRPLTIKEAIEFFEALDKDSVWFLALLNDAKKTIDKQIFKEDASS